MEKANLKIRKCKQLTPKVSWKLDISFKTVSLLNKNKVFMKTPLLHFELFGFFLYPKEQFKVKKDNNNNIFKNKKNPSLFVHFQSIYLF